MMRALLHTFASTAFSLSLGLSAMAPAVAANAKPAALQEPLTLEALESLIVKSHAGWQAAEPSAMVKALAQKGALAGAVAEDEIGDSAEITLPLRGLISGFAASTEIVSFELPPHFDWREIDQGSMLPPVQKQGECGSCVAFAAISTLETELNIRCAAARAPFGLSRQYFFSCGGGSCQKGWKLSQAVEFLVNHGVPDDGCFPYLAQDGKDISCALACSDAKSRLVTGIYVDKPTKGFVNVAAVKRALSQGPVLANLILYEDLKYYTGGVYRHIKGHQLGSHAIMLVGWSDDEQAWIARNSWGETWGDGGYFKIAWDDVSLPGRYTWRFDVSEAVRKGVCSMPR